MQLFDHSLRVYFEAEVFEFDGQARLHFRLREQRERKVILAVLLTLRVASMARPCPLLDGHAGRWVAKGLLHLVIEHAVQQLHGVQVSIALPNRTRVCLAKHFGLNPGQLQ